MLVKNPSNSESDRGTENPWGEAICFVCTKCGEKISPGGEISEILKRESKSFMRRHHPDKKIRIATSSCLGLCPEKQISMAVFPSEPSNAPQTIEAMPPDTTPEQLVSRLLKVLSL